MYTLTYCFSSCVMTYTYSYNKYVTMQIQSRLLGKQVSYIIVVDVGPSLC